MNTFAKAVKISDNVYWVGAIDWKIRNFHGYGTGRGTTYNAFLVMADKITLIDTVKAPFKEEMNARIRSVIPPEQIDFIISNHAEMDHSGSLTETVKLCRPEKVISSKMGKKALFAHYGEFTDIQSVKTGDEVSLGNMKISFIETRMLHWPDSMFSYLHDEQILFSQDAFGMHLATTKIFADENDQSVVEYETKKYFANILNLYSDMILKTLDEVLAMNLPLKIIATDHGPIWREGFDNLFESYKRWSEQKTKEKAVILYDTMWKSTEKMANAIAEGLKTSSIEIAFMPMSVNERSDVATEVLDAGALIVGTPTLNNNIFPTIADVLTYLKGLRFKNLLGMSFGSYGWSPGAIKQLNEFMISMNCKMIVENHKVKYVPGEKELEECFDLGIKMGRELKKTV